MNDKVLELVLELLKNKNVQTTELPFEIDKQYFLRTVTYHLTGKLVDIKGKFLIFDDACWIADTGRFADAMKKGIDKADSHETEPWNQKVFVNVDTIVDACEYTYSLPKEQE